MNDSTEKNQLLLLHLSDIHFEEPYCLDHSSDPDYPVRKALINDVSKMVNQLNSKIDAILISGDIAHKGNYDEYTVAKKWLSELACAAHCPESQVFTVPGNHDVCRTSASERLVEGIRTTITKGQIGPDRDRELQNTLLDDNTRNALISPMKEYNNFAASYGCDLSMKNPFWVHELPLANGWKVVIHGLTSTLFSGPKDDKPRDNLYIGSPQYSFSPDNGTIRLAMVHHPPDWVCDCDAVEDSLWNGCEMHLIGHKHRQRHLSTKTGVRLSAGAVNPARNEGNWEPGYNLINLQVYEHAGTHTLKIDSYLRKWQGSPDQFIEIKTTTGETVFTDHIILNRPPQKDYNCGGDQPKNQKVANITSEVSMDALSQRDLVLRFWKLSTSQRWELINSLGLLENGDAILPEPKRYRKAFERAYDSGLIEELRIKIEKMAIK